MANNQNIINPISQLIAPDIATQQAQLARRQQIADMLRMQALQPQGDTQVINGWAIPKSPLEGLSRVAQALVSKKLQSDIDQQNIDLSKSMQNRMVDILNGSTGGGYQPQQQPLDQPQQLSSLQSIQQPAEQNIQSPSSLGIQQSNQNRNNYNLANLLRGQVISQLGGEPAASSYWRQFDPTDATKMAMASGQDIGNANLEALQKANYIAPINARAGSTLLNPRTGMPAFTAPHVPEGYMPQWGEKGQLLGLSEIPGSSEAITGAARAQAAGKAAVTPISGYDEQSGKPKFTNALEAATGGGGTTREGGAGGAGGGQGKTINVGRFGGYTAPSGTGRVSPGLSPGIEKAAENQAVQNAKRSGALIDAASESPTRINVLDNIINLSKSGIDTGPTSQFTNQMKGYVASIPGFGAWKDDVTGYQEIKKFLKQNSIRAWQSAGGSGTDAQLAAAEAANPNDKMFPRAIQVMANFAKAGELALQAKASAQDQWLAQNTNNPAAQNQFESVWRKNYDPRIFQMKLMDPKELQSFVSKLSQSDKNKLMDKYKTSKMNGWIE